MNSPRKNRLRVLSGMRPTGRLHLGNFVGALENWLKLQEEHECFFFVADWHALTTDFADTQDLSQSIWEMVADWLAAGLDPNRSTLFVQSHVREHAELYLLFSMVTPLGWLERVPTYKEQRQNIKDKDLGNYGFLGYPVLQAADILMYKANFVPVGEDQVPHIELTREIARRFTTLYPTPRVFPEPEARLTRLPRLPGTDGRKMSKSYDNYVLLSDPEPVIRQKLRTMVTDPARKRRTDPGNPDVCPVYDYHKVFSDAETLQKVNQGCRTAGIGCIECKSWVADRLIPRIQPLQEKRQELEKSPQQVWDVLAQGAEKAAQVARQTMQEVREAMRLREKE
jgi:tryptophanyl-tRNA synthetase